MKRLVFLANIRMPTERAHGLQIMKMCECYAAEGLKVTLIVPRRRNKIKEDPYKFYSVAKTFDILYIWCPDFIRFGPVGFLATCWIAGFLSVRKARRLGYDWIYTRDGRTAWFLSKKDKFVWESHEEKLFWWERKVLKNCFGLVTLNYSTRDLHKQRGPKELHTHIAPSAVSLEEFETDKSKEELRETAGFPRDRKVVLYTGHLYTRKGVDTVALSAMELPEYDFVFIGGTTGDIERFRGAYEKYPNIKILGHKQHKEIAHYLMAADLLLLPNSAKDTISLMYTSPIKLFEYMASGTPILSSDLPSAREVLDESICFFFKPDAVEDLKRAILEAFSTPEEMKTKATKALAAVGQYTYTMRAKNILRFVGAN